MTPPIRRMIENSMDCRAMAVRDWLIERFAERTVWLRSELQMAAKLCCIDLEFWLWETPVKELRVMEDMSGYGLIYRLETPLELCDGLDPAVIEAAIL